MAKRKIIGYQITNTQDEIQRVCSVSKSSRPQNKHLSMRKNT